MTDSPFMSLRFTLPWAPSVNHYWHHIVIGGKFQKRRASVRISEAGERYQREAVAAMRAQQVPRGALKGRLAVSISAYPPDQRVRDLDNVFKGVLDVLKLHGVIQDDGDIDDLHIRRGPVRKPGGLLDMAITELAANEPRNTVDMFHHREARAADALKQVGRDLEPPLLLAGKPPF